MQNADAEASSPIAQCDAGYTTKEFATFTTPGTACTCTACQMGYEPNGSGGCKPCTDPAPSMATPSGTCITYATNPITPGKGTCACAACKGGTAISTSGSGACDAVSRLGMRRRAAAVLWLWAQPGTASIAQRSPCTACCAPSPQCTGTSAPSVCKTYADIGAQGSCTCTACQMGYELDGSGGCKPCTDPAPSTATPSGTCITYATNPITPGKGTCACAACKGGTAISTSGSGACDAVSRLGMRRRAAAVLWLWAQPGTASIAQRSPCTACCAPSPQCTGTSAPSVCKTYADIGAQGSCTCTACQMGYELDGSGGCKPCTDPAPSTATPSGTCITYATNPITPGKGTCACAACKGGTAISTSGSGACDAVSRLGMRRRAAAVLWLWAQPGTASIAQRSPCTACCAPSPQCTGTSAPSVCKTYADTGAQGSCTCTACQMGYELDGSGGCKPCTDPAPSTATPSGTCITYATNPITPGKGTCACAACTGGTAVSTSGSGACDAVSRLGMRRRAAAVLWLWAQPGTASIAQRSPCTACCAPSPQCTGTSAPSVCKTYADTGAQGSCTCTACQMGYELDGSGGCKACTDPALFSTATPSGTCITYATNPITSGKGTCACAACTGGTAISTSGSGACDAVSRLGMRSESSVGALAGGAAWRCIHRPPA